MLLLNCIRLQVQGRSHTFQHLSKFQQHEFITTVENKGGASRDKENVLASNICLNPNKNVFKTNLVAIYVKRVSLTAKKTVHL